MAVRLAHNFDFWSRDRVFCVKNEAVYALLPLFYTPFRALRVRGGGSRSLPYCSLR